MLFRRISLTGLLAKLRVPFQRVSDRFRWNDLNRLYPENWFAQRKSGDWNVDIRQFCEVIFKEFKPNSVADVGCGPGVYLQVMRDWGAECIFGLEGTDNALNQAVVSVIQKHDLRYPYYAEEKFDLVLCLEVAEHIHTKYADTLVQTVFNLSRPVGTIIFTAAVPGQGGFHHINLKPRKYWIEKFEAFGCHYNDALTGDIRKCLDLKVLPWLESNLMVFEGTDNKVLSKTS